MKKLSLAILLTSLIGFNSYGFTSDPPSKGLDSIINSFDQCLTSFFNHDINLDESLKSSCLKFVEKEVDGKDIVKDKNYAYFHQMWTLSDPLDNYKYEAFTNSFDEMIKEDVYKDYFSRMEGKSYWVEVVKKDDKYYLVVAVN
jgi:hypothetical protein